VRIEMREFTLALPLIGTEIEDPFSDVAFIDEIRELKLHHLVVNLDFSGADWQLRLQKAVQICEQAGTKLQIKAILTSAFQTELEQLTDAMAAAAEKIHSVLLLHRDTLTTPQNLVEAREFIGKRYPGIQCGAGTNYNFTEINRQRFDPRGADFTGYSMDPQEHAFDETSIVENLEAQAHTVDSTRAIYNLPVSIAPIALRRRYNPYTTQSDQRIIPYERRADPRQSTPFCAAWTLGSIKHVTEAGLAMVGYHCVTGAQGILSPKGQPYPVYEALRLIGQFRGQKVISTRSTSPLLVDALCFEDGTLLLWSYKAHPVSVELPGKRQVTLKGFEICVL
jgi:hypothetical protein